MNSLLVNWLPPSLGSASSYVVTWNDIDGNDMLYENVTSSTTISLAVDYGTRYNVSVASEFQALRGPPQNGSSIIGNTVI